MDIKLDLDFDQKNLFEKGILKREGQKIILDINLLIEYRPELYDYILDNPERTINHLKGMGYTGGHKFEHLEFVNWKEEKDISNIRAKDLNRIVKINGIVNKITDPLALVIEKKYECLSCGGVMNIRENTKESSLKCSCGSRKLKHIDSTLQDIRELIIEELQENTRGKQPQKIRVRLSDELTKEKYSDLLRPGNRVSIIGVIDIIPLQSKQDEEVFHYRIRAIDVLNLEESFDDTIKEEDIEKINDISNNNPIQILSDSLAPDIWGVEDLKKIILLQMVGGVKRELDDGKFTRDFSHILVVGCPSTSKTQLAKNVHLRCPKSFYASGDGSSGVGLTVSLSKDEILGSWGVEVGPIVKASGSLSIVDELDKFPKDQLKSLHTPMESGIVQISKAGIDSRFPAETSILALANPKHGIFEDSQPMVEQISLPPALLSRFDIIYILRDDVDKDHDDKIAEVIYLGKKKKKDFIPIDLFRKYISHARSIKPELKEEHLKDLQEFYHDVRKKSISRDSKMKGLPIGTRHLQGLIRMAESSAKINLRESVEKEDFELAKRLFYDSLINLGMDEGGIFDLSRIVSGKTISKRKMMDFLMDTIRKLCANGKSVSDSELRIIMREKGMDNTDYDKIIYELNKEGSILKEDDSWRLF